MVRRVFTEACHHVIADGVEGIVRLDAEGRPVMVASTDGEELTMRAARVLTSQRVLLAINAQRYLEAHPG